MKSLSPSASSAPSAVKSLSISAASVASCEKSRCYTVRIGSIGVHFPPETEIDLRAIAECDRYPVTEFETWQAARDMALSRHLDPEVFTIRLEPGTPPGLGLRQPSAAFHRFQ